jgi:hypothetical protein
MAKITEKQLISKLKELGEIKPRQEWASLLKAQILDKERAVVAQKNTAGFAGVMQTLSASIFQKKLAYSFAGLLFFIIGMFGFVQYTTPGDALFPVKRLAEQSSASLIGKTLITQDIEKLSNRINDLAVVSKNGKTGNVTPTLNEISINASELAKNLKENKVSDLGTIKEIAISLKTLASVSADNIKESEGVKDLYETIVSAQIADLKTATLTDGQKEILTAVEDLYAKGKYAEALEQILQISN